MENYEDGSCDVMFEDDCVYQAVQLMCPSMPLQPQNVYYNASDFESEQLRISGLIKRLENDVFLEKDEEIEKLKQELFTEQQRRIYFEEQVLINQNNLYTMRFEIGSFIKNVISLIRNTGSDGTALHSGGLNTSADSNNVLESLAKISNKFLVETEAQSPIFQLLEQAVHVMKTVENAESNLSADMQANNCMDLQLSEDDNGGALDQPSSDQSVSKDTGNNNLLPEHRIMEVNDTSRSYIDQKMKRRYARKESLHNKSHGVGQEMIVCGETVYFCLCGSEHSTHDALMWHLRYYNDKQLKCSICGRKFTWACQLKKHFEKLHHIKIMANDGYECPSCKVVFSTVEELNSHIGTVHSDQVAGQGPNHAKDNQTTGRIHESFLTKTQTASK